MIDVFTVITGKLFSNWRTTGYVFVIFGLVIKLKVSGCS